MSIGFFKNRKATINNEYNWCVPRIEHGHEFVTYNKTKEQLAAEEAPTDEHLDEEIANGDFIEPWKYQQNDVTASDSSGAGYFKLPTNRHRAQFTSRCFWVEDLHNWCVYRMWTDCACERSNNDYAHSILNNGITDYKNIDISMFRDIGVNCMQLCVWNGKNSFVGINNLRMPETYDGVSYRQNNIIYLIEAMQGEIIKHRGRYLTNADELHIDPDPKWYFSNTSRYNYEGWYQSPVSIIHALILEGQKKYSIYDKDSFQCKRGKSNSIFYWHNFANNKLRPTTLTSFNQTVCRSDFCVSYQRANVRQGVPIGCPAVFRLANGELALSTIFNYGGQIGAFGEGDKQTDVDMINQFCVDFFGDGKDKTIAQDWLRYDARININEEYGTEKISSSKESSLDKTLIEQNNIKTVYQPSMTLTTDDVSVQIEEPSKEDYVSKW